MSKALYLKIEEEIRSKIIDGSYPPGYKLSAESDLMEEYGVSRITVRNAMINLANAGLIVRQRGKGSYVSESAASLVDKVSGSVSAQKTIAFIAPALDNPHTDLIFRNFYKRASAEGYSVLIYQTYHDCSLEEKYIRTSIGLGVSGIVVYPVQNEKYNEEIVKLALKRFPIVLVDRTLEGININSVVTDNEKSSYDATSHLINTGHKKIGFISYPLEYASALKNRHEGFIAAHRDNGLYEDRALHCILESDNNTFSLNQDSEALRHKIDSVCNFITQNKDMTSLICTEPIWDIVVFYAIKKLGIKVPEELSVVFYDDFYMSEHFFIRPTTVKQNSELIGESAFELLQSAIDDSDGNIRNIKIESSLVVRDST